MKYLKINIIKIKFFFFIYTLITFVCFKCNENKNEEHLFFKNDESGINVSIESLRKEVIQKKGAHVVLLYREGCPYCVKFKGLYKKLAHEYKAKVSFCAIKFDDDEQRRKSEKTKFSTLYNVEIASFPCLLFYKNGVLKKTMQEKEEDREKDNLKNEIDNLL